MSFRKIVIFSVISVSLIFSLILFFVFNNFYSGTIKSKLREENIFAKKVAQEFLEKEKDVLLKQATQIGQTPYVYVTLWTNKLLSITDVRLVSDDQSKMETITAQVMNPIRYMKLINEQVERLYGSNISEAEKRGLALYSAYGGKGLQLAAHSRSYPKEFIDKGDEIHMRDSLGSVGRAGSDVKFAENIGDRFYLKAIHNPNKVRNFGLVVNGRELGIDILNDIKNIVNKEIFLIKDGKVVKSTIFIGGKPEKEVMLGTGKNQFYYEAKIDGIKYGIDLFPIKGYDQRNIGFIGVGYRADKADEIYYKGLIRFTGFAVCFAAVMIIVIFITITKLFKPFGKIIDAIGIIERGEYTKKIDIRGYGELNRLSESINRLSEAVEVRERELIAKNEELRELDKLKDFFLANTSHELKTPLNGIIGAADSIKKGAAGEISERMAKKLDMIIFSGKRLAALVNDILDFSKIKNKRLALSVKGINLYICVENVMEMVKQMALGKKIGFINNVPREEYVYGDEARVEQILYNLIGNAVKFTQQGFIAVDTEQKGSFIEVTVSDTGIGIETENLERIFKSFEQIDGSETRNNGGIGLGLAITKELVELHGGNIWVKSKPGKGSRFTFSIKKGKREERSEQIKREVFTEVYDTYADDTIYNANTDGGEILIVDDDHVNLQVLGDYLALEGYRCLKADNGAEALRIVDEKKEIEAVILDVMMPGMSGYEVCRKIRERYTIYEMPVLMLTAKDRVEDKVMGLACGANDYLSKPIESKELYARMKTLTGLSRAVKAEINAQRRAEAERQEREWNQAQAYEAAHIAVLDKLLMTGAVEKSKAKIVRITLKTILTLCSDTINRGAYYDYYEDTGSLLLKERYDTSEITAKINFLKLKEEDYKRTADALGDGEEVKGGERIYLYRNSDLNKILSTGQGGYIKEIEQNNGDTHTEENILAYPVMAEAKITGAFIFSIKGDMKIDMIAKMCREASVFLEKLHYDKKILAENKVKEYRCQKCGNKLMEYKGVIEYVSIKCRRCEHINEINHKQ